MSRTETVGSDRLGPPVPAEEAEDMVEELVVALAPAVAPVVPLEAALRIDCSDLGS